MLNFFKGIVVGIGGVAPGLSGSVLLVIFGLYQDVIDAAGTLFLDLKRNVRFLIPLATGIVCGVLIFSKVVDFLLTYYEFETRFAFLGLIVGTIPLFWGEVVHKGFSALYGFVALCSFVCGIWLVYFGMSAEAITNPNVVQSCFMGVAYAGSAIIPGVDSAAIMSALGLYVLWVESLADLNLQVLIPAAAGLGAGLLFFSCLMHLLIKHFYTLTFSFIFGLFLSIIPSVLRNTAGVFLIPANSGEALLAATLVVVGCAVALFMGDIEGSNKRIGILLKKLQVLLGTRK